MQKNSFETGTFSGVPALVQAKIKQISGVPTLVQAKILGVSAQNRKKKQEAKRFCAAGCFRVPPFGFIAAHNSRAKSPKKIFKQINPREIFFPPEHDAQQRLRRPCTPSRVRCFNYEKQFQMSDFVSSTYKRDSETRFGMTKISSASFHLAIEILKQVQNDKNFILKKFHNAKNIPQSF